ncbi:MULTISPECIES: Rv3235 family protein [unclassified Streptomyces]|uniref:Rv3235 family protein n=1 Tax=unclassified Streptomyces TaxID=2593676 RepID=UPI002E246D14
MTPTNRPSTRATARPATRATPHAAPHPTAPHPTAPHPAARPAPAPHPTAPRPAPPHPGRRPAAGTAPPRRTDPRRPTTRPGPAARPVPPHLWFAERLLDVLTGRRPLTSLAGRVRDEAYQRLWKLHAERADWRRRARGRTPYVCRCRVFPTAGGALEVTAVVALDDDVVRAIAFRLEPGNADSGPGYGRARWHCTDVAAR